MKSAVAVIGSDFSAVGAIRALRARGIQPTVIDKAERLDGKIVDWAEAMATKLPAEWTQC